VRHLFVCTNDRASGKPACGLRRSPELLGRVQTELIRRGAVDVMVTPCACLGPCFDGPNAVVYPEGIWYEGLTPDDASAIVDHLVDGTVLTARLRTPPGADD
jgi:(2Fe-2S) ferredoxin